MKSQRPSISKDLKNKLLVEANHVCTICSRPGVQLHHIDGDSTNNCEDNLIVLCLAHHDEAEKSKAGRGLSSNLTPDQLHEYKNRLKAGLRPTINRSEPASSVNATVSHVEGSTVIVSAGDASVTSLPHTANESRTSPALAGQRTDEWAQPTIGIITALTKEYAAVKTLLENQRELTMTGRGAGRRYLLGEVRAVNGGKHLVALALADMGNNIAAARATLFLEHFPNIDSIVMVGIAGGIPHPEKPDEHVRLGDVVVSNQRGVIQYDFDKETITETIHRYPPRPPSAALLEGARLLEAVALEGKRPWLKFIDRAIELRGWTHPSEETDILASSTNPTEIIPHPQDRRREKARPRIFVGPIASANKLLKNPIKRDELRDRFGVKAVEMEGSGIADATWNHEVGYLVVRGICDYCDVNKGDDWQEYAAIVAAAYTLALLESIPSQSGLDEQIDIKPMGDEGVPPPQTRQSEGYSLLGRLSQSDQGSNLQDTPWRPSIDLATVSNEDEDDVRYLETLLSQDPASPEDCASWRQQLAELRSNLRLVEERLSEFVTSTDPANLQLVKRQRELEEQIAGLKKRLATQCVEDRKVDFLPASRDFPNDDQRADWREQLAIHRKNLSRLEAQVAKYGSLDAPLRLLNQIDDERTAIRRLEARIG